MRTKTIAVDAEEQELLNKAAREMTGATDMPYGTVIRMLVREATGIEEAN